MVGGTALNAAGCQSRLGTQCWEARVFQPESRTAMIEYRRDAIAVALHAKGYNHFDIHSFRVFGLLAWQVDLYDEVGTALHMLGGPAATYPKVIAQIDTLHLVLSSPHP